MIFESNIIDDAEKHVKIYDTIIGLHNAYDNLPKCPDCGHKLLDHNSSNQPPGCWNCNCKRTEKDGMDNIKNATSKPRVIGPCTGKNCGHCRYLNETLKELKKKPVTGSLSFEQIEQAENLKKVLDLHKKGRSL